jgi:hypothetical protein
MRMSRRKSSPASPAMTERHLKYSPPFISVPQRLGGCLPPNYTRRPWSRILRARPANCACAFIGIYFWIWNSALPACASARAAHHAWRPARRTASTIARVSISSQRCPHRRGASGASRDRRFRLRENQISGLLAIDSVSTTMLRRSLSLGNLAKAFNICTA